jgi:ABC-type antimicrobial peptide transport system permease subunit
VFAVRSLEAAHAEVCGPLEFALMLVGSFAAVALVLSAAGVYGVAAYSLSTRTREIGIRIALGASRRHVVSQVLAQGLRWALIGCAIGAAGAFALGKILISKVWWIKADMLQLTGLAALLLGVIAVLACYVPARRATRIDPAEALRAE